ncbi:hypothetical protein FGW20_00335 [Methanoculleus sp. FWC-SCC3]|uniref:Uncharacterized protein n=1 Tax=Methanoculleus methanifontis TaxID=2584086 RepID=A0ABT8M0W7_9EURY|nr:hypothetical protein [Methanoculleus sp. FWC-SCC3]MDN7011510.1 hypothetical protein [Methanoculleus sp. FWC-SCC3]
MLEITGRPQGGMMDALEAIMTRRSVQEYTVAAFALVTAGYPAVSVIAILLAFAGWTWSTATYAIIPLVMRILSPER